MGVPRAEGWGDPTGRSLGEKQYWRKALTGQMPSDQTLT
jgi:hypothetical protein